MSLRKRTNSTVASQINYTLDANGNLTSDGLRSFEYDGSDRLSKVILGSTFVGTDSIAGNELAAHAYLHNAAGQRVFKSEPKTETTVPNSATLGSGFVSWLQTNFSWLWSTAQTNATLGDSYTYADGQLPSWALLGEYGNGGASSTGRTEYIWLPTANGQAIPVGLYRSGQLHAIHTDHLGTPRLMVDRTNTPVWQWAYSAFGDNAPTGVLKPTTSAGSAFISMPGQGTTTATMLAVSNPTQINNLRFPGQYADSETGLFYNYFRTYQPNQGRYTQNDPIGLDGGWNRMGYVEGNPLSFTDPDGLRKKSPPIPGDFGKQPYVPDYWRNDTTRRFRDGYYTSVCVRTSCELDSAAGMCTIDDLKGTGKFRTAGPFMSVAGQKTPGCECTRWALDWREGIRPPTGALDKMNLLLHTFSGGGYQ